MIRAAQELANRPRLVKTLSRPGYALFLARGGAHGDDWTDWLQAEAELRAEGTPATDPSESEQSARG